MSATNTNYSGFHVLITGSSGLVGSHLAERTLSHQIPTTLFIRNREPVRWLEKAGAKLVLGDLSDDESIKAATPGITHIVHCAAKVGDWGTKDHYLKPNVGGMMALARHVDPSVFQRFIHISSLGVYPAGHHVQTDETSPVAEQGVDGYTHSKIQAEKALKDYMTQTGFPAIMLRPGFIYGPRDRTILPKLIDSLRNRKFAYLGPATHKMNNTYVGNLVSAIMLALNSPQGIGNVYNITDPRLVSKQEFIETICRLMHLPLPTRKVPYQVARTLAVVMESAYRLSGKKSAPLLSQAKVKFLGANLDFSIEKAKSELDYHPSIDFQMAMATTINALLVQ